MTKPTLEHRSDFFKATKQVNQDHVLIVLNYSLPSFVPLLWEQSRLRVCADGGANRIYDELPRIFQEEEESAVRARYIPDAIVGDLDSLRPDVRDFYTQNSVPIIDLSHDQDTSDLHKCIKYAQGANPSLTQQSKLLVVGAVGGRLDHQLSNIHILYKFRDLRIVLLGKGNLALLLPEAFEHEIYPDRGVEGPICALIPVGSPVSDVHSTGLRWNLGGQSLQFGELISTSNEIKAERISVRAKGPLLWTTELTGTPGLQTSSS
ncbi:thiamin pyrophosphokinase [Klebsormidium nitens]|uniref:Thiamine pyrophosphokinase n=1 Tax=Klebsormidium nitens TaxID=105231 RepID=A0A1Y1IJ00_KLENI|nr:thiamin pyrophosphokinase [Klebsormidium nitens]|eukprot:GAQ89409.1 thiamin pyrophosphokinase [Klebsormidium nitens]